MLVLYLMQHCIPVKHLPAISPLENSSTSNQSISGILTTCSGDNLIVAKERMENEYLYVLGNLLSQGLKFEATNYVHSHFTSNLIGIPFKSKRLSFRMVAGVWTLAAFFFVQTYNSTLITYIITPVNVPLMSTVQDIVENPDIYVFIKKAGVSDTLLSVKLNLNSN